MQQFFETKALEYETGSKNVSVWDAIKDVKNEGKTQEETAHFVTDILGKRNLCRLSENDHPIDMCVKACNRAFEKAGVTAKDVDVILLTCLMPEYYSPNTGMILHNQLGCRDDIRICMDVNTNCTGMINAVYMANAILSADDKVNTILIADATSFSNIITGDDLLSSACGADSATALVLSRRSIPTELKFEGFQDPKQVYGITGPIRGVTDFRRAGEIRDLGMNVSQGPDCQTDRVVAKAKELLAGEGMIKHYCFSQYVKMNIDLIKKGLGLTDEEVPYIGGDIGYTGPSSPFIALKKHMTEGSLKKGDKVFMWSVALGVQHSILIFEY